MRRFFMRRFFMRPFLPTFLKLSEKEIENGNQDNRKSNIAQASC